MKPNTLKLRPSDILWTQSSIKNSFCDGRLIGETLDELCNGTCQIQNIRRIRVFRRDHCWWSLDNRRLWVFREFERLGGCAEIVAIPTNEDLEKLTTNTFGKTIRIRGGDPGGKWHKKPNRTLAKERNRNNENHPTAKNASDMYFAEANKKPIQQSRCSDLPPSRKHNNSKRTVSYLDEIRRELGFHDKTNNARRSEARNISTFSAKNTTDTDTRCIGCSTDSANTSYVSAALKKTRVSLDAEARNVSSFSDKNTTSRPGVIETTEFGNTDARLSLALSANNSNSRSSRDSLRANAYSTSAQTNVPSMASTIQYAKNITTDRKSAADFYQVRNVGLDAKASDRKLISSANNNSTRTVSYLGDKTKELSFHAHKNNVSRTEVNTTARRPAVDTRCSSDTDSSGRSTVSANNSDLSAAIKEARESLNAVARRVSRVSTNNATCRPVIIETRNSRNSDTRGRSTCSASNSNPRASSETYPKTALPNVPSMSSTSQSTISIGTDGRLLGDFFPGSDIGFAGQAADLKEAEWNTGRCCCAIS